MPRIHLLDSKTSNAIAAGEVIERPMSVVKELMENSLDAGATMITVEIRDGGISYMRISDDGCGMDKEDAINAFICHATSKINDIDELFSLHTMGFRGEALASISACSKVKLCTREPQAENGTEVVYEGGKHISTKAVGTPCGTTIEIRELFYNLPARYKFLKKDTTEAQAIQILIERFILIHPDISFRFIRNGREVLHSPGNNDAKSALYTVFGKDVVAQCRPIDFTYGDIRVKGFVGLPVLSRSSRADQIVYVNQRLIRSKVITSAIDAGYQNMLMKRKYAFVILDMLIPAKIVDVNVHPQKSEVRFSNESDVYRAAYHAIAETLSQESMVIDIVTTSDSKVVSPANQADIAHVCTPQPEINTESSIDKTSNTVLTINPMSFHDKTENTYSVIQETTPITTIQQAPINTSNPHSYTQVTTNEMQSSFHQEKKEEAMNELGKARFIGTLFNTFILLESNDQFLMIDQHAAHEKILFEQFVQQRRQDDVVLSQPLIVPMIVSLSSAECHFIEANHDECQKLGFEADFIGDNDIAIRAIPSAMDTEDLRLGFITFIDQWMHDDSDVEEKAILALATAACKAAVKGHDVLAPIEIERLLQDMSYLKDPFHCPHGRPIILRMSHKEIEKNFKRIV